MQRRFPRLEISNRLLRIVLVCITGCLLISYAVRFVSEQRLKSSFRLAVDGCAGYLVAIEEGNMLPGDLEKMLDAVDHTFILSFDSCMTRLPHTLVNKATCVRGQQLDICAPKQFTQGPYKHGMKVSFMHAAVMRVAQLSEYKHIAVIEDDAIFRHRTFSASAVEDFRRLLRSHSWTLIRFGYRPYFLEESSRKRCPPRCQCTVQSEFGPEFCRISRSGCDLRSSDLYVARSNVYLSLQKRILDVKRANSKRIIDKGTMASFADQWLMLPPISLQTQLDVPLDFQLGLGALFVTKCVVPRPLSYIAAQQYANRSSPQERVV